MGNVVFSSHQLVAKLDGFAEELLIEVHHEQPLTGGIFRIEQTDIGLGIRHAEVVAQYAVVEQQLHIMRFQLQAVGAPPPQFGISHIHQQFDIVVLARLVLHQQPHICGHQVNTPLQAQLLADERRLQNHLLTLEGIRLSQPVVARPLEQNIHHLAEMIDALLGIAPEVRCAESFTRAILQCLFPETARETVSQATSFTIDDIIESRIRKVTKQDRLRVGTLLQSVHSKEQRMVTVVSETGCYGGDIHQEIGLHHYQAGYERLGILVSSRIEQVQLHPLTHRLLQISVVDALFLILVVDGYLSVVCIGIDKPVVPTTHDASDVRENSFPPPTGGIPNICPPPTGGIPNICPPPTGSIPNICPPPTGGVGGGHRNQPHQRVRNVGVEYRRYQQRESPHIAEQVLTTERLSTVGVAAHRLNGYLVCLSDTAPLAEIIHLREHVSVSLPRVTKRLGTAEHQRLVQIAVGVASWLLHLSQRQAPVE